VCNEMWHGSCIPPAMKTLLLALLALPFCACVLADTRSSDENKVTKEPNAKTKTAKKKPSASAGASRPALDADDELAFKKYDLDGDGEISKAEAAGTDLINAFDRGDRNKDGKLSRAEYARVLASKRRAAR